MNLSELLRHAVTQRASDLHLAVGRPPVIRVDDILRDIPDIPPLTPESVEQLIMSIVSPKQREEFLKKKDLDFSYAIADLTRFRMNLHFERENMGLVARVIPPTLPTMEEISMPPVVYRILKENRGLILLTGPAGTGKSTSLAAMVNFVNEERAQHIITLEDPIEFVYTSKRCLIRQRELGVDMISFAEGLRHVLRQDPDLVVIGEMRDLETIATTITLAETGHLVIGTLHTFNASQTVDRIIDSFPDYQQSQIRTQISMTLLCIIAQKLLPKRGGGRIAAREILLNTNAIGNLIRENKISQIQSAIQMSAAEGMFTMDQDIVRLYRDGLISKETAESHVSNHDVLDGV